MFNSELLTYDKTQIDIEYWHRIWHLPLMNSHAKCTASCNLLLWVLSARPPDILSSCYNHKMGLAKWRECVWYETQLKAHASMRKRVWNRHIGFISLVCSTWFCSDFSRDLSVCLPRIPLVCASGKSADEMLALLKGRIGNATSDEVRIAAEEHAKIADIRLGKLLADSS